MIAAVDDWKDMNSKASGSVLMDNTTIHGAIAAYNEWPPLPTSWRSNPYAVNLRSLMDIIEAVVLFDTINLDGACKSLAEPAADEDKYDSEREWQPFQDLRDPGSGEFIFKLDQFSSQVRVIGAGILATAAERLQKHITDGRIQRQADLFQTNQLDDLSSDLRNELRLARAPGTQVTMKLAVPTGVFGMDIPVTVRTGLPEWLERMLHRRPHLRFLRDLALSGIEFAPFELTYRALQA